MCPCIQEEEEEENLSAAADVNRRDTTSRRIRTQRRWPSLNEEEEKVAVQIVINRCRSLRVDHLSFEGENKTFFRGKKYRRTHRPNNRRKKKGEGTCAFCLEGPFPLNKYSNGGLEGEEEEERRRRRKKKGVCRIASSYHSPAPRSPSIFF